MCLKINTSTIITSYIFLTFFDMKMVNFFFFIVNQLVIIKYQL